MAGTTGVYDWWRNPSLPALLPRSTSVDFAGEMGAESRTGELRYELRSIHRGYAHLIDQKLVSFYIICRRN